MRLVLVSDRWESWLSQVADAETKQAMRQHPHLSKLFFHNIVSISKIDDAKLRTIRGKFAKKCLQTCEFNKSFDNVLSFTTPKNSNFTVSEYQGKSYEPVSNYLESSASSIFTATLLRGIRLGLLPKEKYDNGTWTLIGDCAQKNLIN